MSPLQIEILLQSYSRPDGCCGDAKGSIAHRYEINQFVSAGLLLPDGKTLTKVGQDCVNRLLAVPMTVAP